MPHLDDLREDDILLLLPGELHLLGVAGHVAGPLAGGAVRQLDTEVVKHLTQRLPLQPVQEAVDVVLLGLEGIPLCPQSDLLSYQRLHLK